jgi:hypothetical protein
MKKFILANLFLLIISMADAEMTKQSDNYKIYSRQLDVMTHLEGNYKSVELFTYKNGIAVLCLCDLDRAYEMRLFCFDGNSWSSSRKIWEPPNQQWHGMTINGSLQIYSISNSAEKETISFYSLDGTNKLSETPSKILSFKTDEKYFPNEVSRQYLRVVAIDSNELFLIGKYTESKMNPITFLGAVISGGHSGYANRLFGMRVRDNTILGQYNIPERIENNGYADLASTIGTSQNIFIGWVRGQNYSFSGALKWMRAQYDLTENRWQEPIELFRDEGGADFSKFYAGPFFAIDSNNVLHSVWSYTRFRQKSPTTTGKGSGVFYRSGYKTLAKTQTITDAISPKSKIVADKSGKIHIFWTQNNTFGTQDSGLFHWQSDGSKIDLLIPEQRVGVLDVAVSSNNDIHVVFVKFPEASRNTILEYVKIMK